MAPSAIAEVPINKETCPQVVSPAPRPAPPLRFFVARGPARAGRFFNEALLENHRFKSSSKTLDYLVALLFHVAVMGAPILAGLSYTDTINLKAFATTLLVALPPPPPPPPAPASVCRCATRCDVGHSQLCRVSQALIPVSAILQPS